ncbi:MAG: dTMP kinase [Gemmatimonadota bacterium]
MGRGTLIVLEGGEGVGKTTQIGRLGQRLTMSGLSCLTVREPGSTRAGNEIREFLLRPGVDLTARSEALLFMASRAQLVRELVKPALDSGVIVLADRFFLSTYAYQVYGRGLAAEDVRRINAFATGGLRPDLTLLLKLKSTEGLARVENRGPSDRMEAADAGFHARVEAAFSLFAMSDWQAEHPECGPIRSVDGSGSVEEVAERLWEAASRVLGETFSERLRSQ